MSLSRREYLRTMSDEMLFEEIKRRGWELKIVVITERRAASLELYDEFCEEIQSSFGLQVDFTGQSLRVMQLLIARKNKIVSLTELVDHLYGHDPEGGPLSAVNIVHQRIANIRKFLRNTNYRIDSITGVGYKLAQISVSSEPSSAQS